MFHGQFRKEYEGRDDEETATRTDQTGHRADHDAFQQDQGIIVAGFRFFVFHDHPLADHRIRGEQHDDGKQEQDRMCFTDCRVAQMKDGVRDGRYDIGARQVNADDRRNSEYDSGAPVDVPKPHVTERADQARQSHDKERVGGREYGIDREEINQDRDREYGATAADQAEG